jgi:hypothetical protein
MLHSRLTSGHRNRETFSNNAINGTTAQPATNLLQKSYQQAPRFIVIVPAT